MLLLRRYRFASIRNLALAKGIGETLSAGMNIKIILHLLIATALCAFGSGCCTYLLVDSAKYTTHDTFNPSAVYQTTNNRHSFALEGTRYNNSSEQGLSNSNLAFVIMPKAKLIPSNLRTNDTLSIGDIQTLPPDYTKSLKTKNALPANYEKITTLSTNSTYITIKDHHPKRVYYVFVPLTVAADIVTAPVQLVCVGLFVLWAKC
jgi:hypothetical protein